MDSEFIKKIRNSTILVVSAQVIVLMAGIIKNLLVPYIYTDVEMYALWQIYIFYLSYILIFTFGFNDGIYLKYTGTAEKDFKKDIVKNSIKLQMFFMILISTIIVIILMVLPNFNKKSIYILIVVNLIPLSTTDIFLRIFQAEFKMKKYSFFVTIDKILFAIFMIILCFFKNVNEYYVIAIDIFIKIFISIILLVKYRKYWTGKIKNIKQTFREWADSCKVGSFVLISSYLLILLTGIGRILIEGFGNLTEYAMYSFAISIASIITVLINAIGTVLFPALRSIKEEKYKDLIKLLNTFLITLTPIILICYFLLEMFVNKFLPKYILSLNYLSLIMCMVIVKCFVSLIYTPVMKSLRLEKKLLRNNIISLGIFSIIFIPLYIMTRETIIIAIGTLIVSYIELCMDEHIVNQNCHLSNNHFNALLGVILLLFIIFQYNSMNILCIIIQTSILVILLIKYHTEIIQAIKKVIKI